MSSNIFLFCLTFLFETSIDTSSIYDRHIIDEYCLLISSNKGLRYRRNRIGEIGDPCDMPVSIDFMSSFSLSNERATRLFDMKSFVQFTMFCEIPRFFIVFNSLSLDTLSNAPFTSNIKHDDTYLCELAFWISCVSLNAASTAERCFRSPICSSCSSLYISA